MLELPTEHSSIPVRGEPQLFTILSDRIGEHWAMVVNFLLMVDDPDWTTDEVFEAIKDQKAQVWGVSLDQEILGIWITRIQNTRRVKYGLIWILAGRDVPMGLELFKQCEAWLKEMGCKYIEIQGRPGWAKVMPEYKQKHVVLRKPL